MIDRRIALCVVASVIGHLVTGEALDHLPARAHVARQRRIAVRVIPVEPPEPLPEPPPEPPKPEPTPEPPRPEPVRKITKAPAPTNPVEPTTAPPPTPATTVDPSAPPVFGVSMESTSTGGNGPSMPVGSTAAPQGARASAPPSTTPGPGPGAPVAAAEVTKMPLPQGRCAGTYTDAARDAGLEGVVVLDLVVDETGRARNIRVVEGLGHGLSEAAVRALEACRFSPGERDGKPVAVRVRSFKIRFVLQEGN